MATKYIRHGETYCGDGTTNAAAGSNGGVGAWNNINVFEGSAPAYGSAVAAGDLIYIRSKDAAGANITRVVAASTVIGSSAATSVAPVTWVVDGGTVWSGINGVLTYSIPAVTFSLRQNNKYLADVQDALKILQTEAYVGTQYTAKLFGLLSNVKIDMSIASGGSVGVVADEGAAILQNCTLRVGSIKSIEINSYAELVLINTSIEMTSTAAGQFVFYSEPFYGSNRLSVSGGRIWGVGAIATTTLLGVTTSYPALTDVKILGLSFPTDMPVSLPTTLNPPRGSYELMALDGATGTHYQERWGWATSRSDNNPPVLSGQLPDSGGSLWAWRLYPQSASMTYPLRMTSGKLNTSEPATKTITLEFLTSNTHSVNKADTWMTVEYVDNTTGLMKSITTLDPAGGALPSSTAAWNVVSWGLVSCVKNKLSITTPTTVKKDKLVIVTLWSIKAAVSTTDILFLDSDFALL